MSKQLEKIKHLIELREKARMGGGERRIEAQHKKGKQIIYILTANKKEVT